MIWAQASACTRCRSHNAATPRNVCRNDSRLRRILTGFLEYGREHVRVQDLLHEREGARWLQRVSS
jgi:hypothetical protein